MMSRTRAVSAIAILAAILSGCSILPWGGDGEEEIETSEQMLYRMAQRSLRAGNYSDAITRLESLEARFPFGRYAEQAQLELIYAHYMSYQPQAARTAADRFIRLHPQHPNVDYAYYLKGLAAFNRDRGLFDRFFATDISKRDQTSARDAFADFSTLVERYPRSEYAPDARQRMIYLRNVLARSEVHIADYYMSRGAHVAAANRARYVVENYPQSTATADALAVLVEASYKLGLEDAANDALRVLAINYPDYPAFDESGQFVAEANIRNRDRSFLNLITLGLLDRPDVPPPLEIEYPDDLPEPASRPHEDEDTEKKRWWQRLPGLG